MNLDEYQEEFVAASAARQWQLLTANDGFLLEKEFAVREKTNFIGEKSVF